MKDHTLPSSEIDGKSYRSYRKVVDLDRHVGSLPEMNLDQGQMKNSNTGCLHTSVTERLASYKNSESSCNIVGDTHHDVKSIQLFRKILLGYEPSRQPGSASAWINIQHGGGELDSTIVLNEKDALVITKDCGAGSCKCEHYVGHVASQLKPCGLGYWFVFHEKTFSEADVYVLYGAYYGFPILDATLVDSYECVNYSSITEGEGYSQMSDRIVKELATGKISVCTTKPKCIHALGALFKSDGKIRPITDCKRPLLKSINNAMETSCYAFSYSDIDDVCAFLEIGDYLCVVDIDNAYRSINVYPSHVPFQAFSWIDEEGIKTIYQDHCLCFGIKSAPYIFTQVGNFMVKCLDLLGITRTVNYIDDFLICEADLASCTSSMRQFLKLLSSFGFAYNESKLRGPDTTIKYLGILVDSQNMILSLPQVKLDNLMDIIVSFKAKTWSSKVELQKLAGNLSHASTIIKAGRTFSRRVFDIVKYFPVNKNKVKLSSEFRSDLEWWLAFARMFNGVGRIIKTKTINVTLYTDASGSGFGGILDNHRCYFFGSWNNEFAYPCSHVSAPPTHVSIRESISQKELWPILSACQKFGSSWTGLHVCIYSDNQSVCTMVNKGRSREVNTMAMLREIFWVSFIYNFTITCRYVRGLDNVNADLLSRLTTFSYNYLQNNSLFATLSYCCRKTVLAACRKSYEPQDLSLL